MNIKKRTAILGLFAAVAIIFGYIESLIPLFAGTPGIKPGLANLAVLLLLLRYSWKEAALVSAVRILVIGFLFGSLFSIIYSLCGAALSLLIMTTLVKKTDFSPVGISVAGGVMHNIGQLVCAAFFISSAKIFYYAPVLLVSGTAAGILVGFLTGEVNKRLPFERDQFLA